MILKEPKKIPLLSDLLETLKNNQNRSIQISVLISKSNEIIKKLNQLIDECNYGK